MERRGIPVQWSALFGISFVYHEALSQHVVKPLLLLCESNHDVTNAQNNARYDLAKVSSGGP